MNLLSSYIYNFFQATNKLNISITIIAADRQNGYITQSVAFLLDQMKTWPLIPVVAICNVEGYVFDELKQFADKLPIHSINIGSTNHYDLSNDDGRIKKESDDYWKCMNNSHGEAEYVLLVEDDAVPVPYFQPLLTSLMDQMNNMNDIDYVKLFHPWSLRKIPCLFHIFAFGVFLASLVSYLVYRRFSIPIILLLTGLIYLSLYRDGYKEVTFKSKHINYNNLLDLC